MIAPAPSPASLEVHHEVPRCLLRLRDRADAAGLTGEGIQRWLDFEHEAMRWGVDPDVGRDELDEMIEASTVEIREDEHRETHAENFRRWGSLGGAATLRLYGPAWFGALARRRWNRITAEALAEVMDGLRSATEAGRS